MVGRCPVQGNWIEKNLHNFWTITIPIPHNSRIKISFISFAVSLAFSLLNRDNYVNTVSVVLCINEVGSARIIAFFYITSGFYTTSDCYLNLQFVWMLRNLGRFMGDNWSFRRALIGFLGTVWKRKFSQFEMENFAL